MHSPVEADLFFGTSEYIRGCGIVYSTVYFRLKWRQSNSTAVFLFTFSGEFLKTSFGIFVLFYIK